MARLAAATEPTLSSAQTRMPLPSSAFVMAQRPSQSSLGTGCSKSAGRAPPASRRSRKASMRVALKPMLASRTISHPGAASRTASTLSRSIPSSAPTLILKVLKPRCAKSRAVCRACSTVPITTVMSVAKEKAGAFWASGVKSRWKGIPCRRALRSRTAISSAARPAWLPAKAGANSRQTATGSLILRPRRACAALCRVSRVSATVSPVMCVATAASP